MAGALKNVLAIAAGIVEGMQLGNNCMAALVAQGCAEIRWLAEKVTPTMSCTSHVKSSGCGLLSPTERCRSAWKDFHEIYTTFTSNLNPFSISQMGAKSATLAGLSGTGDIMLTCFVKLSRNRSVGVRLGAGEKLEDILASMNQVRKYLHLCLSSYVVSLISGFRWPCTGDDALDDVA